MKRVAVFCAALCSCNLSLAMEQGDAVCSSHDLLLQKHAARTLGKPIVLKRGGFTICVGNLFNVAEYERARNLLKAMAYVAGTDDSANSK